MFLKKRTQFVAYLRPERVNARDFIICVLSIIARKGQSPQLTEICFVSSKQIS